MAKNAYKVTADIVIRGTTVFRKGDTVYPISYYSDAADKATAALGERHVAVCRTPDGKGNSLAVPATNISSILVED